MDKNKNLPNKCEISTFTASDSTKLRLGFFASEGEAKATILLINGHREFLEKYTEFIEEFQARGFNVYSYDHRGQGLSDRKLEDPVKSHNPNFGMLVSDIDEIITGKIKPDKLEHPFYIVAHSLGAHLALRYMHDYPDVVDRTILLSPFTGFHDRSVFYVVFVKLFFAMMNLFGFGNEFAVGQAKNQQMIDHENAFLKLTHDKDRYQFSQDAIEDNSNLFIGGVTYGGAAETVKSLDELNENGYIEKIKTSVLCLLSEDEKIVSNDVTVAIIKKMPNAEVKFIANARHEIYRETNEIRDQMWQKIDQFFSINSIL